MIVKAVMRLLFLSMIATLISGCVAKQQPIVWSPDSNETIRHFQNPVLPENHKDYALTELWRGQLFFSQGDRQHSDQRFRNALEGMERIESDSNETSALMLAEQKRTYRGQPYERATAYFFRGLCHYQLGHYEKALAAFRSTLAEDEETNNDDPVKRKDYLAAYYMQAQCLKALGEIQEAEAVQASAREFFPEHPLLAPDRPQGNLIVIAGIGYGPWMVQGAFWTVEFKAGSVPESECNLSTKACATGELFEVTDLLAQAESNKAGGATGVAVGRAIGKEVINAFVSVLAGRDAGIHENRDLRCWSGIPRKFYIGSFDLPEGLHTLTFNFSESGNQEDTAPHYQQTWYDIPVKAGVAPQLLYVSLLPNGQNFNDLVPVSLENAIAVKKKDEAN